MTHRLMCVFAHPDDESLGMGATLAKYAALGTEIQLVCATRGQRGWPSGKPFPGLEALGRIREGELLCAAEALGIPRGNVTLLDYIDGDLDQADPPTIIAEIARLVRRHRPQVVVTFAPDGAYGHPDHIAISQFTLAALLQAAGPEASGGPAYPGGPLAAHAVSKAYAMVEGPQSCAWLHEKWPGMGMAVDGVHREMVCWPEWALSAQIDAAAYAEAGLRAIRCHRTQIEPEPALANLTEADVRAVNGLGGFVRLFSRVNGGRAVETDLFAGIAAD